MFIITNFNIFTSDSTFKPAEKWLCAVRQSCYAFSSKIKNKYNSKYKNWENLEKKRLHYSSIFSHKLLDFKFITVLQSKLLDFKFIIVLQSKLLDFKFIIVLQSKLLDFKIVLQSKL